MFWCKSDPYSKKAYCAGETVLRAVALINRIFNGSMANDVDISNTHRSHYLCNFQSIPKLPPPSTPPCLDASILSPNSAVEINAKKRNDLPNMQKHMCRKFTMEGWLIPSDTTRVVNCNSCHKNQTLTKCSGVKWKLSTIISSSKNLYQYNRYGICIF